MLTLEYALCEGYNSPSISMIQTVTDVRYQGVGVSVFLSFTVITGTIAAAVVGSVDDSFADSEGFVDPSITGNIMAVSTVLSAILASVCFYMAGIHYEKFKRKQKKDLLIA